METEVIYDDKMNNKYLVKKSWDGKGKKALIIMKHAGDADAYMQDQTTMYTVNNLITTHGSVEIANLFSTISGKETKASIKENFAIISKAAERVDDVIIAVGKGISSNKEALNRLDELLEIILKVNVNILEIEVGNRRGFHPLYPAAKREWGLVPYEIKEKK
jgi:hypothetical protein